MVVELVKTSALERKEVPNFRILAEVIFFAVSYLEFFKMLVASLPSI